MIKLALINLSRNKTRTFLTGLSIAIGICSLFLITSLDAGLKKAVFSDISKTNPLNQITVHSQIKNSFITPLLGSDNPKYDITDQTITKIKSIPEVTAIYPEMAYNSPAMIEASIFGLPFQTDATIFGVPQEFIAKDLNPKTNWQADNQPYPVIVSRKLLDLYNLSVAGPQNLPQFTDKNIIGKQFSVLLNYSSFFANFKDRDQATKINASIQGLSDKTNLIGATLPLEIVKKLNQNEDPEYTNKYVNLYVTVSSPEHIETVAQQIESMELETNYLQKKFQQIQKSFRYLTIALTIVSTIILFMAALSIASTFFANVHERYREIGILRTIGANRSNIKNIFLVEAIILGIISAIIGIVIGLIIIPYINASALDLIPDISSKPESIFLIEPTQIGLIILFAAIISTISAFIPASKAASTEIVKALYK